jgi:hypothetical protein
VERIQRDSNLILHHRGSAVRFRFGGGGLKFHPAASTVNSQAKVDQRLRKALALRRAAVRHPIHDVRPLNEEVVRSPVETGHRISDFLEVP